jgi:hypothetical protein
MARESHVSADGTQRMVASSAHLRWFQPLQPNDDVEVSIVATQGGRPYPLAGSRVQRVARAQCLVQVHQDARGVENVEVDGDDGLDDFLREIVDASPVRPATHGAITMQDLLKDLGIDSRVDVSASNAFEQRHGGRFV